MKKIILGLLCIGYAVLLYIGFRDKDVNASYIDSPLYQDILKYANENNIMPVESKYDTVWKIIPGVNGKIVDVEKSYNNMKKENIFNEDKIVFIDKNIKTSIKDLPSGPIYKGNSNKKQVSFMINVAWGEEYINDILKILEDNEVTTTFFIDGTWAKKNGEHLSSIINKNHEIANHSLNHKDFTKISKKDAYNDILETNTILSSSYKGNIKFFTPPSGAFNDNTINALNDLDMQLVMFSVDTIDWQKPSVETIKKRVGNKVEAGSIILMHPTLNTKDALTDIILDIRQKGLDITTISSLLSPELVINKSNNNQENIELE